MFMFNNRKSSEAEDLEQYRISFENVAAQPEIAAAMLTVNYTPQKIAVGEDLLAVTRQIFDLNIIEDDETSVAYNNYLTIKKDAEKTYARHRKLSKVIFRNDPVTAEKLAITGSIPRPYINWIETSRKFYTTAASDPVILEKLLNLNITTEEITASSTQIADLEAARAIYHREIGESQETTQKKDAAFAEMDHWMSDFYTVARVALEDHPQLLESLGVMVRS